MRTSSASAHHPYPVENVQAEILSIFDHLTRDATREKEQAAAKRRLAARRAIEQHFERKALEDAIRDEWDD
ncbi:PA3496 family putative envelope integrity protein [Marinobacter sp. 1Y8]